MMCVLCTFLKLLHTVGSWHLQHLLLGASICVRLSCMVSLLEGVEAHPHHLYRFLCMLHMGKMVQVHTNSVFYPSGGSVIRQLLCQPCLSQTCLVETYFCVLHHPVKCSRIQAQGKIGIGKWQIEQNPEAKNILLNCSNLIVIPDLAVILVK